MRRFISLFFLITCFIDDQSAANAGAHRLRDFWGSSEGTGTRGGGEATFDFQSHRLSLSDFGYAPDSSDAVVYLGLDHLSLAPEIAIISEQFSNELGSEMIFNRVLQRLKTVYPDLSLSLTKTLKANPPESWTKISDTLPKVNDYSQAVQSSARGSKIKIQVIYRFMSKFFVDQNRYQSLSAAQRAGLMLHEYLYLVSGQPNANRVRAWTAFLMSREFFEASQKGLGVRGSELGLATLDAVFADRHSFLQCQNLERDCLLAAFAKFNPAHYGPLTFEIDTVKNAQMLKVSHRPKLTEQLHQIETAFGSPHAIDEALSALSLDGFDFETLMTLKTKPLALDFKE
jgi:hypothetical protein